MITASLSPNTEFDDLLLACKTLCTPWTWKKGKSIDRVYEWFHKTFGSEHVSFFSSGRVAGAALLSAFGIGTGDEVLVQAFTCVAVPNIAVWAGATPVYVDIDDSGNMSVEDAQKKITTKTKAIIVQHTFGIAADMEKFVAFAKKHELILIEDCAHSLGVKIKNKLVGTFADAAFFSFGRDKVLSSVWGGVAIVNSTHASVAKKLQAYHASLPLPSYGWIGKQLLHPLFFGISMPLYRIGIGKALIGFFRSISLITLPIFPTELHGGRPEELSHQYPNALATLILVQLSKLDRYTAMRASAAAAYKKILTHSKTMQMFPTPLGATHLRFPILVDDPQSFINHAKKQGILLGNWYSHGIDPKGVSYDSVSYDVSDCPRAETISKQIVNLPTRITKRETDRVVAFLSDYV